MGPNMFKGNLCLSGPSIQEVLAVVVIHEGSFVYGVLLIELVLMHLRARYCMYVTVFGMLNVVYLYAA